MECTHCQRVGDARKRALLTEREVLELIHKRVGWKLADEDLQGEKRWREREEGGGGQMEGGGRRWEIEQKTQLFHSLAYSQRQPVV